MKSLYSFLSRVNSSSTVKLSASIATNPTENLLKKFFLRTAGVVALLLVFGGSVKGQVTVAGAVTGNGTYTTLGAAFTAIGTAQASANITITITGNTTEAAAGATLGAGTWTTLTIAPSGGSWTVSGAITAGSPLIYFNGSDNVTVNGGGNLTFSNTTVSATSGTATIQLKTDATNNTFNNVYILGSATMAPGTNGGNVFISTGTTTGNDGNSFQSCKFGPAGTNLPSVLFYGNGSTTSTAVENSGITINNCEFYDYFQASSASAAIYMSTGNTAWTVTNNKIYQTAARTITTAQTDYGIYMVNAGATALGESFTVTGNTIGYASNSGTGTMTYSAGATAGGFVGINLNYTATTLTTNTVSNNIVSDIQWTSTSTSAFTGINTSTVASTTTGATHTVNGNTVRNINFVNSTGALVGINVGYAPTTSINTNTLSNITRTGSSTFYAIQYSGTTSTAVTLNGNVISNLNFNNTTSTSNFYVMYSVSSPAIETITNNTISNIASTSTGGQTISVIFNNTANGTKVMSGNTIYNVSLPSTGTGTIYGLRKGFGGTSDTVNGNTIYAITGGTNIYALAVAAGTTNNIFNNKVYGLSSSVATPAVYGIYITGGTTNNIYNNIVGAFATSAANTAIAQAGIYLSSGTTNNVYYNTVYLSGASSGALFGTTALYASTTPTVDLRNNILVNASTANGATGFSTAYRRSSNTLTSYASTSNNNLFYGSTLFYDGTTAYVGLAAYQTLVSTRDAASKFQNPTFASTTGSDATFLHFTAGVVNQAGGFASIISGYTTDFDGNTRDASTPDIGADEFVQGVAASPTITSYSPSVLCVQGGQTVTITGTNLDLVTSVTFNGTTGTISGQTATSLSVTTPANLTAGTIIVTSTGGAATSTAYTTEATPATPTVTGGGSVCTSTNLVASNGSDGTMYWQNTTSNGTSTVTASASQVVSTSGTYYFRAQSANGCWSAQGSAAVTISTVISITTQPSGTAQSKCVGVAATALSVAVVGTSPSYQWYSNASNGNTGGTLISGATSASYTPPTAAGNVGTTYYYCVVSSGAPCNSSVASSVSGSINVFALPTISISSATNLYCGTAVSMTASGANSYSWSPSSTLSPSTGPTVNASPTATTTYTVTGTDLNNCTGTATKIITKGNPVTMGAVTTAAPSACAGATVQLNGSASISSLPNQYAFSATSGTFAPLSGATAISGANVDSYMSGALPIGFNFNYNGTSYSNFYFNSNGYLAFTSTIGTINSNAIASASSPILAPLWDDNDGASGSASYLTSGIIGNRVLTVEFLNWEWNYSANTAVISFQVKLYESNGKIEFIYRQDAGSVNTGSSGATIGISGAAGNYLSLNNSSATPTASAIAETTTITTKPATGQVYSFTPPTPSYTWTFTNNSNSLSSTTIVNPISTVNASDTYTLTASGSDGCSASGSVAVALGGGSPTATASASSASLCVGASTTLSSSVTGGCSPFTYSWSDGTSAVSTASSFTASPTSTKTYTLTVTDNNSATSTSSVVVTVNSLPTISVNSGTFCSAGNALSLNATGASLYTWAPATGLSAVSGSTVNASPTSTTTYTVTGTDSNGCISTTTSTVTYAQSPSTITIAQTPSSVCSDNVATLTGSGGAYPTNRFTDLMNVLSTNFTTGTVGTGTPSAALNTTYFAEGTGSVLFNTASTSASVAYTLNSNVNLLGASSAQLTFSHICATEAGWDYGYVEYSSNGGTSWTTFPTSSYTGTGTLKNSVVSFDKSSYSDWGTAISGTGSLPTNLLWKTETINIPVAALTSQFRIRYRYTTDSGSNYYGWLIDNVNISATSPQIVWSPTTNLFTNAAATTPYTGGSATTVYALNTASTQYTATSTNGSCSTSTSINTSINPLPTITLVGASAVCAGGTSSSLTYTATAGSPNQYIIDFDATANTAGFVDVASYTAFSASPIALSIPSGAAAGTYNATITVKNSTTGCISSATAFTVTINTPVSITAQPNNSVSLEGSDATFSVTVTGTGLTYQWQLSTDSGSSWNNASGTSTSSSYTEYSITSAMAGYQYRCIVSGTAPCGSVTSSVATLTISTTAISTQPASATICSNSSNTFSIATSGSTPTYQWQVSTDGGMSYSDISGETMSSLTVSGLTASNSGNRYRCVLSGSINSDAAVLTVYDAVAIATQPTAQIVCSNATNAQFSVSATGSNLTYQWQVSTNGGSSWSNASGSSTGSTYTVSSITNALNLNQYRVIVSGSSPCSSVTSVAATLNVIGVSLATSSASICMNGSFTLTATPTSDSPTLSYSWICATAGSGATVANTSNPATITPTAVGSYTYTLTTTGGGCTLTSTQSITVNANPVITSATASPASLCSGSNVSLSAGAYSYASGVSSASGTGNSSNGTSTYPSPFGNWYFGAKQQFIISAADLTSMGLSAGNITAVRFDIATPVTTALTNYTISAKHTNTSSFTSSYTLETGLTTLFSSSSYTPSASANFGNNAIIFTTPFNWNGTSNIVLEICFNNTSYTTNAGCRYTSKTNYVSCWYGSDASGVCSATTGNGYSQNLPNMKFVGQLATDVSSSYSWSWNTTPVVSAVSGTTSATNISGAAVNQTYTVTATNASTGCYSSLTTSGITVNSAPISPVATNSSQCGIGVPSASVSDPNGFTSPTFKWYAASTGGTALQTSTSATYTTSVSATTTYYVSVTNPTTGCESGRTAVTITVNTPPALTLSSTTATNCAGSSSSLVTLVAGGTEYDTYAWSPSATVSGSAAAGWSFNPGVTTTYTLTASQTTGACVNTATVAVTATPLSVAGTATASNSSICVSGTSVLTLTGNTGTIQWQESADNGVWSNVASSGTSASYTTPTLTSTTYYRANVTNSICTSAASNVLTLTVNNPQVVSTTPATICTTSGTVTLNATGSVGSTLNWYAASTGGASLGTGATFTTPLISATTSYYVAASNSDVLTGLGSLGTPTPSNTLLSAERGIVVSVSKTGTLNSAQFYAASGAYAGTARIVDNATGTQIASTSISGTAASAGLQTMNLNWALSAGSTYRLLLTLTTGSYSNNNSGVNYATSPWNNFGNAGTINSGYDGGVVTTTYSNFYNMQYTSTCESGRTAVAATLNPAPSITPSSSATICAGQSATLSVSSSNTGYTYSWSNSAGSGSSVSVSPSATTTYTVTATDASGGVNNGCSSVGTVSVTVNPLPTTMTITPSSSTLCNGVSVAQSLVVSGGNTPNTGFATLGTGTSLTSATAQPTAFCNRWSSFRMQTVYTASELQSIGLTAGNITSMAFNITTLGDAATNSGFVVKIGNTTSSTLSGDFVSTASGFTTVYPAQTYTHSATGWQTIPFSTPYYWDGASNIIIDIIHNGANATNNSITYYTATSGNTVAYTTTASTNAASFSTNRLNVKFGGQVLGQAPITWSPVTALYTDAAATTAYTGTSTATVYGKPTSTTTYTATATSAAGCTSSNTVQVTVNQPSVAPTSISGTNSICIGSSTTLTATGGTLGTGATYEWGTGSTVGSNIIVGEISASITVSPSATTTYWVRITNGTTPCTVTTSGVSTAVTVTNPATPVVTVVDNCNGTSTLSTTATGTLAWSTSETTSPITVSTAGTYTVTQTVNGCTSAAGSGVAAPKSTPATPVVSVVNDCGQATLSFTPASNATILWSNNATTASATTVNSETLTVVQTVNGCPSSAGSGSAVPLVIPSAPTATASQNFCVTDNATVGSLAYTSVVGNTYTWYDAATAGNTVATSTQLPTGTTNYYLATTGSNGCTSTSRTAVAATEAAQALASVSITGVAACPGGVNEFTATPVNGGPSPTYQWYNGGVPISGATSQTYSATGLAEGAVITVKMIPSGSCVTVCP